MAEKGEKKSSDQKAQQGENQEAAPNAEKRSLSVRITIRFFKIVFFWVPVSLLGLIFLVMLGAKLYLSPERVEKLVIENFNARSYGEMSLNVREFSPFGGFIIENILIKNGEEFNNSTFVEIKRLVFHYEFSNILIGNVRIPEIGIYKPRIHLVERNGVWNAARLMRPGEPGVPEEEDEPDEPDVDEGPPSAEINLPISIEFLFKFILDDLRVYVDGSTMKSKLEGLSFGVDIWVPPFKTIPKSLDAIALLDRMKIELNPAEEMNVTFSSREAAVRPPLILTWKLQYKKKDPKTGEPHFASRLKLGTHRMPVRFKRVHLTPLNFMVSYDLRYEPKTDFLRLNHFGVMFSNRKLIYLKGHVKNVSTKQMVDLRMTESSIVLNDLYPYFRQITGNRSMRLAGRISLAPLTIKGTPDKMDIKGQINMRRIYFRVPGTEARIPSLRFSYDVRKRGDNMQFLSSIRMPHLYYVLNRSKSGDNGLSLGMSISAYRNFSRVRINRFAMNFYNPGSRASAFSIALDADVKLRPSLSGTVNITKLRFNKNPLVGMVTRRLRKTIKGIPLKKPVTLKLSSTFSLAKNITSAALSLLVKVPDFKINDLTVRAGIVQNNRQKRLYLKRMRITSREKNLTVSAKGVVDLSKAPLGPGTDLSFGLKLHNTKMVSVHEDWMLSGLIKLDARQRGDLKTGRASGSFKIAGLNVKNPKTKMEVTDFNMNFPFEFNHRIKKGVSRIALDKSILIENEFFKGKENFTIKSIKIKHPARDISFEVMKDFAATMFFRNNTFEIEKMKAYLIGGALYGRNILFNLSDFKKKNMEYNLTLDLTNVDIGLLDDPDPKTRTREAELSLNAQFKGKGVDIKRELTPVGYINIYKVGDEFANRLLKGLSKEKGQSKLGIAQFPVDNSMNVKGFNFNLDKGLVYTTVSFERRAIGWLLGIEKNQVKFDRIKLQEYLRNILGGE